MYFPEPSKKALRIFIIFFVHVYYLSKAEKFIESIEQNKNYPVLLLHLMDKADMDMFIRVSAAIAFKNFVKRNWRVVSVSTCVKQTKLNVLITFFFIMSIFSASD